MLLESNYHYDLPEGYELKPETREKLDALVAKCGLSNEEAQEFINLHVELMDEYADAYAAHKAAGLQ